MSRPVVTLGLILLLSGLLGACVASSPSPTTIPTPSPEPTPEPTPILPTSSEDYPWWNQAVFYQVFVRSFADSTEGSLSCDGIGDLQGLIDNLDYLNDGDPTTTDDLGVTALWLMPIKESPSYHGYDVSDYYNVAQDYGTNEDFLRLMEAAHERGMYVIVDLVLNHTSTRHPWFQGASRPVTPTHTYYRWDEDPPNEVGEWGQQIWHRFGRISYFGVFWSGMPDLNFENPEVTAEMYEVTRYWLEDMQVDGFRLDAIRFLVEEPGVNEDSPGNYAWFQDYYDFHKSINPDALTIGEAWTETDVAAAYVTSGGVDMVFEFDQASAIITALNTGNRGLLAAVQRVAWETYPHNQFGSFLTNHDQERLMTQLGGDEAKARAAAFWLFTGPGTPFIYYGEEIGMVGAKPDEKLRTPMQWSGESGAGFSECQPWQAPNRDYPVVNVAAQTDDSNSLLSHYRELVRFRQAHPALLTGGMTVLRSTNSGVHAYIRHAPEHDLLVVVNLTDSPISDYGLSAEASELTQLAESAIELWAGVPAQPLSIMDAAGGFAGYTPIETLPPYSGYVVQLNP